MLSVQEKKKVHDEIDRRMQDLEDTGLSRVELLHDSMARKGVQLKDDPFFQLVKTSRVVREMIIPANGEFSADRVIELALRQDFGPDPSLSGQKRNLRMMEDIGENIESIAWDYKKKYRDKDPLITAED